MTSRAKLPWVPTTGIAESNPAGAGQDLTLVLGEVGADEVHQPLALMPIGDEATVDQIACGALLADFASLNDAEQMPERAQGIRAHAVESTQLLAHRPVLKSGGIAP